MYLALLYKLMKTVGKADVYYVNVTGILIMTANLVSIPIFLISDFEKI